jgi:hypothetical protein
MASRIAATAKHLVRTMSTAAAPAKFEFLVIVPDKPGTLQKRLEVRACAPLLSALLCLPPFHPLTAQ